METPESGRGEAAGDGRTDGAETEQCNTTAGTHDVCLPHLPPRSAGRELAPEPRRECVAWLPWRHRASPSATLDEARLSVVAEDYERRRRISCRSAIVPNYTNRRCKSTICIRRLRRALAVHHLRRELGRLGRGRRSRPAPRRRAAASRDRPAAPSPRRARSAPKNAAADLAGAAARARTARSAARPPPESAAPESSPRAARTSRRDRARRRRPSRNTAARRASRARRTLPWKPIVAMWCRPQPFGQPLILMRAPSAAAIEIGPRAQMILEQPAEAARLRHRQPARSPRPGSW